MKFKFSILLIALFSLFLQNNCQNKNQQSAQTQTEKDNTKTGPKTDNEPKPGAGKSNKKYKDFPPYVIETLAYVREHGEAKAGYVGGRTFQNREKRLPLGVKYREWDVKPKEKGKNRGAERLITGDNNTAYYTQNHYKSFRKIE